MCVCVRELGLEWNIERGVKVLIYKAVLIAVQVSFEAWVAGGLEGP